MSKKRIPNKNLTVRLPAGKRRGSNLAPATIQQEPVATKQSDTPPPSMQKRRSFLGPELAAGMHGNEEAPEFNLKMLLRDPKIRDLGLRLWRQFSGMGAANERDLSEAGLSFADLWKPGVTDGVTTSSTTEEIARYRLTLEYRAKFLEALLEGTLADLEQVAKMKPEASDDQAASPDMGTAQARGGDTGNASRAEKEA